MTHSSDNVMDQMYEMFLPPKAKTNCVNIGGMFGENESSKEKIETSNEERKEGVKGGPPPPGSLVVDQEEDEIENSIDGCDITVSFPGEAKEGQEFNPLDILVSKTAKEALVFIRDQLEEAFPDRPPLSKNKAPTALQLRKFLAPIVEDESLFFPKLEIVCFCLSVLEAAKPATRKLHHWDQLSKIESALLQLICEGGGGLEEVIEMLVSLCQEPLFGSKGKYMNQKQVLKLCVLMFSAIDQTQNPGERKEILQEEKLAQKIDDLEGDICSKEKLQTMFLPILHHLRHTRSSFSRYQSLFVPSSSSSGLTYQPLIPRIISDILKRSEPESDIKYIGDDDHAPQSQGIGGLFSTGLRWGIKGVKAVTGRSGRVADNETLIVFVIGGITCEEIEMIRKIAQEQSTMEVLVGSTCLATGNRTLEHIISPPSSLLSRFTSSPSLSSIL